jgi:transposase
MLTLYMYIVTFECEERHFASVPKIIEAKLKFPKREKYVIPIDISRNKHVTGFGNYYFSSLLSEH